jgi:hypothetical protein
MKASGSSGGRAVLALALTAAVFATGCGDDEDEGSSDSAESTESVQEITLTADDVSETEKTFELSATPTPETETVVFDNVGDVPHALVFAKLNEGYTVDEAIELQGRKGSTEDIGQTDAAPGKSSTVEIEQPLEPGDYVMLCPIPNDEGTPHFELGQLEEFSIEG